VLVALTLLGALPVYRRVAQESFRGSGSIAMLERLLPWWAGKLFVLVLLGFAATDFMITITLSAADAAQHFTQNLLMPAWLHGQNLLLTILLIAVLGLVFLKGFREAIGMAVGLVSVYLLLNLVIVVVSGADILEHPRLVTDRTDSSPTSRARPYLASRTTSSSPSGSRSSHSRGWRWECRGSRPASRSCRTSREIRPTRMTSLPVASAVLVDC
jgi:hypothetical protein